MMPKLGKTEKAFVALAFVFLIWMALFSFCSYHIENAIGKSGPVVIFFFFTLSFVVIYWLHSAFCLVDFQKNFYKFLYKHYKKSE